MSQSQFTPQIFGKRQEGFFLIAPLIIVAGWVLLFWKYEKFCLENKNTLFFISDIIAMNTVHTVFTWGLQMTPEMASWRKKTFGSDRHLWLRSGIVIFISGLITYGGIYFLPTKVQIEDIAWCLIFVTAIHHALMQIKGLSNTYSILWQKEFPNENQLLFQKSMKRERRGFDLFIYTKLAGVFLSFFFPEILKSAMPLIYGIYAVAISQVVWAVIVLPKALRRTKFLYLGRLCVSPFESISTLGLVISHSIHGFESGFVSLKMFRNSQAEAKLKKKILWATAVMAIVITVLTIPVFINHVFALWLGLPLMAGLIFSLRVGHGTAHYWLDAKIWEMKKAVNREYVLPLWMGARKKTSEEDSKISA